MYSFAFSSYLPFLALFLLASVPYLRCVDLHSQARPRDDAVEDEFISLPMSGSDAVIMKA